MSETHDKESEIVKFPGIASISLSITPIQNTADLELLEAIVRVYDENNEQIMQQKARSLFTIAKNVKLFIQNRTALPVNDRRMSVWFAEYLSKIGIKIDEEEAYQYIKKASQALEKISRVKIEDVESTDLISIETDVLAKLTSLKSDRLLSEDDLYDLLEKHQAPVTNKVVRTIQYKNSGGVDHKDKITLEIHPSEKLFGHKLLASFKNETEKDLTDVHISDIIPYCYKILDVVCNEGGKAKKELTDGGLKISWNVSKVPSGGDVKAFYNFEKRIPRTIMIRKGDEIRIVQDYNSLLTEENETGLLNYYFISEVINLLPVTLDELIIRDLIPMEMRISGVDQIENLELIDFGQIYGINTQRTFMNVETGTKILQRYNVNFAPMIWKIDLKIPLEGHEKIMATKIIEQVKEDLHICTIVASTPIPCTISNEIEANLTASEFMPTTEEPNNTKKMSWEVSNIFLVSMVLKGNLSRQPNPIKIMVNGSEYTAEIGELSLTRSSQLISIPFNHVALYRKMVREI
ncbi:MAG: hypothetical protein JXA54_06080 [Candidatus Heimdallarchaeota archaeon]|nr:hypothetical protein [Candidatus Heimdallarchaeota archaeon]